MKTSHSCRITCERSESARERRIALYEGGQQQHYDIKAIEGFCCCFDLFCCCLFCFVAACFGLLLLLLLSLLLFDLFCCCLFCFVVACFGLLLLLSSSLLILVD